LEQEEYVAEEISWSFIDFSDNQACIDMIEGKMGILDLLDEESRLPAGKDQSLVLKLYNKFGTEEFKYFDKPRFGEKEFVVKHYALDVSYQIEGFIEKNKDTVSDEQLDMLNQSEFGLFKEIIEIVDVAEEVKPGRRGGNKKPTLGSTFKQSLIQLMETLRKTNPHYIRCIKPNQSKAPFEFEPQNVLGQLIACGVLETIKISRAGYPSKQTYSEFVSRYYFLLHSSKWRQDVKKLTDEIIKSCIKGENKYELGKTKVFFRAGQLAFLEKVRSEKYRAVVSLIQKNLLRNYCQKRFKLMKIGVVKVQRAWRGYVSTKEARSILANLKAKRAKLIKDNLAKGIMIEAEVEEVYEVDDYSETEELESEEIQKALEEAEKAKELLALEAARLEKAVKEQRDKEFSLQRELELQKALKQMSLSTEETADLKKYLLNCNSAYDSVAKASKKLKGSKELQAKLRKRDAHVSSLQKKLEASQKDVEFSQNELKKYQYESSRLKEQLKNAPARDDQTVEALKQELASMRELMARMFQNKNKPEISVEVSNRSFVKAKSPNHASRMSSFFESAAQVTELAAQISTPILEYGAEKATPFVERAVRTLTHRDNKQIGTKYSGTIDDSATPKPVNTFNAYIIEGS
jgi:myosin V